MHPFFMLKLTHETLKIVFSYFLSSDYISCMLNREIEIVQMERRGLLKTPSC